jgi:hypothetical protein
VALTPVQTQIHARQGLDFLSFLRLVLFGLITWGLIEKNPEMVIRINAEESGPAISLIF